MKSFLLFTTILVLMLVSLEIVLRLLGYQTFQVIDFETFSCDGSFKNLDKEIGFVNAGGTFECLMVNPQDESDTKSVVVTHNEDGSRLIAGNPDTCFKSIHFYGGSMTWGHGVDDEETYPALVQTQLPDFCVMNYGAGGFSLLQSYLLFKRNLSMYAKPDYVVLNYGSPLDERNIMTVNWLNFLQNILLGAKKKYPPKQYRSFWENIDDEFAYPVIANDYDYTIRYLTAGEILNGLRLRQVSVFANAIWNIIHSRGEGRIDKTEVSKELIRWFMDECAGKDIELILCGEYYDDQTKDMVDYCRSIEMNADYIAVNHHDNELNLLPYDGHLNSKGNNILANNFVQFFNEVHAERESSMFDHITID